MSLSPLQQIVEWERERLLAETHENLNRDYGVTLFSSNGRRLDLEKVRFDWLFGYSVVRT